MTAPAVSIVIVSRHRPQELRRLLVSLRYLDHPAFEVVVVADPAGAGVVAALGLSARVKLAVFDRANISAARNRGIALAAGEVVAFIDDDSVPEPSWLRHLAAPFADPAVAAAGGFVRGRNGISFQWRAEIVDGFGQARTLATDGRTPQVLAAPPDAAIKTQGTNCAFRRAVLTGLGGFDEGFAFFLDETDVNWRLARAGHATAIVPLAQVHHGFAASAQRSRNRAPRDLRQIGASLARFAALHGSGPAAPALARARAAERARLLALMVAGEIEPRDIARLLATFDAGLAAPQPAFAATAFAPPPPFLPFDPPRALRRHWLLAARPLHWRRMRRRARALAAEGAVVTLLRLTFTALYHQVRFHPDGYWLHRGGVYGRAERSEPAFLPATLAGRARREAARLAPVRAVDVIEPREAGKGGDGVG